MTQKERMLAGQLYLVDEELAAEMRHTAGVLRQFNSEPEPEVRAALLRGLLGGTGTHVQDRAALPLRLRQPYLSGRKFLCEL